MKATALNAHYQQIPGETSPWEVSEVRLDVERLVNEGKLTVKPDAIWACPQCHSRMHSKQWRTRRRRGTWTRAVRRGLARCQIVGLKYVCVDEKAVGRGQDYVTVVTGILDGEPRVLYLGDGRDEAALNGFWQWLGPEACARIKAGSMDMSPSYQKSTRRHGPNADLIFDPFHMMKMLNKAVDEVRRQEVLMGTVTVQAALKQSRQMWLWGEENLPERHAARFEGLKDSTLKTARAWRLKELWRTCKCCVDSDDAHVFFRKWYVLVMQSKLEAVKRVARSFKDHLAGILTLFKHGFCNALAEGVNSRIQLLIQKSCGYRNRQGLKIDILFHFGALNMNPVAAQ